MERVKKVKELYDSGKTINEIRKITNFSKLVLRNIYSLTLILVMHIMVKKRKVYYQHIEMK